MHTYRSSVTSDSPRLVHIALPVIVRERQALAAYTVDCMCCEYHKRDRLKQ